MKKLPNRRSWKRLVEDIKDERCILLLGPNLPTILVDGEWRPINEQLALHLADELIEEKIAFEEDHRTDLEYVAQRYMTIEDVREIDLQKDVSLFFEDSMVQIPSLYKKLTELPFHFIVNAHADDYLLRAYKKFSSKTPSMEYYGSFEKNNQPKDTSKTQPFIYNLLGYFKDKTSLVITEAQQVAFIRRLLQNNPPIPPHVLEKIQPKSKNRDDLSYIFIGFNFNRWQFRILLENLNIHPNSKPFSPKNLYSTPQSKIIQYYESRFNFYFIEEYDVNTFIAELQSKLDKRKITDTKATNSSFPVKIVISYHPEDKIFCEGLERAFVRMLKKNEIELWFRDKTLGEKSSEPLLKEKINDADIILPLLSMDYFQDHVLLNQERSLIEAILKNGDSDLIKVVPIFTRIVGTEGTLYQNLICLPSNGEPMDSNTWGNIDYALRDIEIEIRKKVNEFKQLDQ